jgi:hypothetical protein
MRNIFWGLLIGTLVCAGGCGGTSGDGGASGSPTTVGRGSAACQTWQTAICKFVVGCGLSTQSSCDDNYKAIACKSDAVATGCAEKFHSATCTTAPSGCDLSDVGDPAPAIAACNKYLDSVCAGETRCAGTSAGDCHAKVAALVDCSQAIGVTAAFDTCIHELQTLSCTTQADPQACHGAIKTLGRSMTTTLPPDGG